MAAALLAAAVPACRRADGTHAPAEGATARVVIDGTGGPATVRVEVARTPAQREHGLMDRPALAPDAGMIFVFDETAPHGFWMKNTLVPLDLIFIGDDARVAAVVERAPLSLEVTDGGVDSRYVLEVNRGWAREHGVAPGARVRFENVLY